MKHGSVIVKGGRVISTGVNKERSHPRIVSSEHIKQHCSVHAEVDAIKRAKDVTGATIYVARVNRRGEQRDSRPCNRCYEAIKNSGIKKIVYTTSEE
jgi:deoxycytidylate deaminase